MKHKTTITPLNCAFADGLNSVLRMEIDEYNADSERSIYCKSPDISWFRFKSVSKTPYLEPAFYGVKAGDTIELEYSVVWLSGVLTEMTVPVLAIDNNYNTTTITNFVSTDHIGSNYKIYRYRYVIPPNFAGIGIILNMRPNEVNNEIIIKDIEVTIETSNPLFSMVNNNTSYITKTDFMQCIDYVSGTTLNPTYNGLLTVYGAGQVLFPDDYTMQFSGSDQSNFKGLLTCFNGYKYRPNIATYAEYLTDGTSTIYATAKRVSENGDVTQIGSVQFPPTTTIKKKIMYMVGGTNAGRKTFIDLGRTSVNNFTLKNVRFSMPQFDDSIKRHPNQLEDLYTNLRTKLR